MDNVRLTGISVLNVNNATGTIADGFLSASLANLGDAEATIIQNGQSFSIPASGVFNFPVREGNLCWYGLSINATGTEVECVYF
jgi:hypothetical protein